MHRSLVMALTCAVLLAGCGGGSKTISTEAASTSTGTGSTTTGTTTTTGSTTTATVTPASLTATTSATSIPSDGSATATITVLARNSSNDLISGVTVAFAADSGGVAITNAVTDTTGAAVAVLSTAGDSMPRTITVTATSAGLKATVQVQVVATSSATTTAVSSLTMTTSVASILSDGSTTATITALARDASNNVLAGVPITFAATSGAIQSAAATTDATGTVTATLSTGGDSSLRTITVTGSTGGLSSTVKVPVVAPTTPTIPVYSMGNGTGTGVNPGIIDFAVNDPGPSGPGSSATSNNTLSSGGTTALTISIVDQNGTLYNGGSVVVTFNSPCISAGSAQILPSGSNTATTTITTTTGGVGATYVAKGCTGADTVIATATVAGQNLKASGTVKISPPTTGSIQFISATPQTIGLKGTGLNETSTLIFKVTDSTGAAQAGVPVTFSLNTTVGGLAINPTTGTSASDGTVQAVVSSGTEHTAVRVTASIAATSSSPALSTQSSQLTVTTGLPASSAFSIAVGPATYGTTTSQLSCPNVDAYGIDGVTVPVTVRLADRYNNPVPDGTAVAFTTNGGHIVGSCTTPLSTSGDGACTVTWTSANPRPALTSDTPNLLAAGRASVLATTIGEESFTDINGTGFWQTGDPFVNLGEPYRDDNENGQYDSGEYFLDFNQNQRRDAGTGSFVGITCTGVTTTSTCSTSTLAIGASHLIIMSTGGAVVSLVSASSPAFTVGGTSSQPALSITHGNSGTIKINVKDSNGNSMAAGTTIAFSLDNTTIGTVSQTPSPFVVPCDSNLGGQAYQASFSASTAGSGNITVLVTSPGGTITLFPIQVTVN